MGFDSFFSGIGNDITTGVDKIGDIGSDAFNGIGGIFSGVEKDAGSLLSAFGLGDLFGGSSGGSSSWKTYLEYGLIAFGVIILAVLIKKML